MIFSIKNIPIYFPYENIYPEQYKYIEHLINILHTNGNGCIQMPSGAGKTISILSATVSYQLYQKKNQFKNNILPIKIIYASRTVPEILKVTEELKKLHNYILQHEQYKFTAVTLSSRKHLCINKEVTDSNNIEIECRKKICNWSTNRCVFYDNMKNIEEVNFDGIFTFNDLKIKGEENSVCPYFSARYLLERADCIIYTYNYLLDPNIFEILSKKISKNSIIIFDEAHNIDNSAIETYSIEIKKPDLVKAIKSVNEIENNLKNTISTDKFYERKILQTECISPFLNREEKKYIPGNLRNSMHFLSFLKRLIEFFKGKIKSTYLSSEQPYSMLRSIENSVMIDERTLAFASSRFSQLQNILKLEYDENIIALKKFVDFASLIAQFNDGFLVIFEPYDKFNSTLLNPHLYLWCLDASIALKQLTGFKNIVLTSGTLSPIETYLKILDFPAPIQVDIGTSLSRNSISPIIIDRESANMEISLKEDDNLTTAFNFRNNKMIVNNYGRLLIDFVQIVPDGIVVFFPSYLYMEEIIYAWSENGIIEKIMHHKLIFIETQDYSETDKALMHYRKAIENGRGAIMFCIARGKVSEGIDFEGPYGRAVILIGMPFQYTESIQLKKRLTFLKERFNLKESEYLIFDAMRQAAQCLGRVLRNKKDYGLMVLADKRFHKKNNREKLPNWILTYLKEGNIKLSIKEGINIAKSFFKEMGQSFDERENYLKF